MSVLLREAIGDSIRRARTERRRTLRDVSSSARVSLGYLSEVERGRKEPSSELLAAICEALSMSLPDLLDDAADTLRPAGPRRRATGLDPVDPVLRSAVEEALGPVTDAAGEDAPAAASASAAASTASEAAAGAASASAGSGSGAEARASASDPTAAPDALAGADPDDPEGVLDGHPAGDLAEPAPLPGTVGLVVRLPITGLGTPVRVAA